MFRYIRAMSDSKKNIECDLKRMIDEVYVHICLIVLYPQSSARDHWIEEIRAFIPRVKRISSTKRFPKSQWLYSIFSQELADMIDVFRTEAIQKENNSNYIDVDDNYLERVCDQYSKWLATELSVNGTVSLQEVRDQIDQITTDKRRT